MFKIHSKQTFETYGFHASELFHSIVLIFSQNSSIFDNWVRLLLFMTQLQFTAQYFNILSEAIFDHLSKKRWL